MHPASQTKIKASPRNCRTARKSAAITDKPTMSSTASGTGSRNRIRRLRRRSSSSIHRMILRPPPLVRATATPTHSLPDAAAFPLVTIPAPRPAVGIVPAPIPMLLMRAGARDLKRAKGPHTPLGHARPEQPVTTRPTSERVGFGGAKATGLLTGSPDSGRESESCVAEWAPERKRLARPALSGARATSRPREAPHVNPCRYWRKRKNPATSRQRGSALTGRSRGFATKCKARQVGLELFRNLII
jgi:hypothetical protein